MSEVQVGSVTFVADNVIQIQYSEEHETTKAAALMRTVVVDTDYLNGEDKELIELIQDIIDKTLLMIRNPPDVKGEPEVDS